MALPNGWEKRLGHHLLLDLKRTLLYQVILTYVQMSANQNHRRDRGECLWNPKREYNHSITERKPVKGRHIVVRGNNNSGTFIFGIKEVVISVEDFMQQVTIMVKVKELSKVTEPYQRPYTSLSVQLV